MTHPRSPNREARSSTEPARWYERGGHSHPHPSVAPYIGIEGSRDVPCEGERMTAPIEMGKFVGAPVRTQTFDGVVVSENTYAAGLRVAAHTHDAPLLSLVLQGNATEEIGNRTRELGGQ